MRRFVRHLLIAVLVLGLGMLPAGAAPDEEVELIDLVNMGRAEVGLAPLEPDMGLIFAGRGHSAEMADAGELYHSTRGQLASYATDWELLGENVGRGPNVRAIHDAFMESESHRANVLGDFDAVGAGVDRAADGTLFVTVVFLKRSADAEVSGASVGPMVLVSGLPEFAVSRLVAAASIFERSGRELCSPVGCID